MQPSESASAEQATAAAPEAVEERYEWQIKAEEYLADLQRVQADFENYKKRVKQEEKGLYAHLTSQIVTDLVPVLTNLHAATGHVPADAAGSPWVTGITYIEKQFEDALRNYGVTAIEVKPGDPFNPSEHEAVTIRDREQATRDKNNSEETQHHTIAKVVQKGYKVGDRVITAAKVVVS